MVPTASPQPRHVIVEPGGPCRAFLQRPLLRWVLFLNTQASMSIRKGTARLRSGWFDWSGDSSAGEVEQLYSTRGGDRLAVPAFLFPAHLFLIFYLSGVFLVCHVSSDFFRRARGTERRRRWRRRRPQQKQPAAGNGQRKHNSDEDSTGGRSCSSSSSSSSSNDRDSNTLSLSKVHVDFFKALDAHRTRPLPFLLRPGHAAFCPGQCS